jgi:hypothetical protein
MEENRMPQQLTEQQHSGVSAATRRTVVATLVASPMVAVIAGWSGRFRRSATVLRPAGEGRSSQRCASCGAADHSMLACPSSPKVI